MRVTSTHLRIIDFLQNSTVDFHDLYENLNLSENKLRTYINDITMVDNKFFSSAKTAMEYIRSNPDLMDKVRKNQDFLPEERKLYLYLGLVLQEHVNLNALSKEIGVSRRTLFNDLADCSVPIKSSFLNLVAKNSKGIFLEGSEIFKRMFFIKIFLFFFIERKYLPKKFDFFDEILNECEKNFPVKKISYEIVKNQENYYNNLVDMSFQGALYGSLLRRKFSDKIAEENILPWELTLFEMKECISLKNILDSYSFPYVTSEIIMFYKIRNPHLLKIMERSSGAVKYLIEKLENSLQIKLDVSSEMENMLLSRLNYMTFKQEMGAREFYNVDKNVNSHIIDLFNNISGTLKEIFKDINSSDKIALFYMIFGIFEDTLKKYRGILLYHELSFSTLNYAFHNLRLGQKLNLQASVPLLELKEYLENHNIEYIVTFENIKIPDGDYRVVRLKLPLTTLDLSKILKILQNTEV